MAIRKSPALHDWLLGLNIEFLNLRLNIGDWIEVAIDWTISWVNEAWEYADTAYIWARAAWDRVTELYQELSSLIYQEVIKLGNSVLVLWSEISDWWAARRFELQEWVLARLSVATDTVSDISQKFYTFLGEWDDFRSEVLPGLINISWWRDFWGGAYANISDWWDVQERKIRELIDVQLEGIRTSVNEHSQLLDMIKTLFTDPETFIVELLGRIW